MKENKGNDRCRGELGYVLGSEYWGRGIVTEAVKMAAKSVFAERENLERIEALVDVDNVGSQRVLEKVGFQREGVLRKYYELKGKVRETGRVEVEERVWNAYVQVRFFYMILLSFFFFGDS